MDYLDFERIYKSDEGIRYLKEHSKVFDEKLNQFLREASKYVDITKVNLGDPTFESTAISFESYYFGSRKAVFSYISEPINRDLDCQYKQFAWIEFSLDKEGNLVTNKKSGRIESKYGFNFEETNGGILETNYSYQVFTPEGIELLCRIYHDQINLRSSKEIKNDSTNKKDTNKEVSFNDVYGHLRGSVKGGYNPRLAEFDSKDFKENKLSNKPVFKEFSRSLDNLGLVKKFQCSFNQKTKRTDKKEEYHLDRCTRSNPYIIPMTYNLPPLAYREGSNNLVVNYLNEGLTSRNYRSVAKSIFIKTLREKIDELKDSKKEGDNNNLLDKYMELYRMYCPNEEKTAGSRK